MLTERIHAVLADEVLWPSGPAEAVALQGRLADRVLEVPLDVDAVGLVAGLDVCYAVDDSRLWAAAVVLDTATWEPVERVVVEDVPAFGYVPGLFAFRELPALLTAIERLRVVPDVLVCDGAGRAHPRRFGLACHLGVLLDVPVLGTAKTLLHGEHGPVGPMRGEWTPLLAPSPGGGAHPSGEEVIGRVVRTRDGVRPVYVSAGHRVDVEGAADLVVRATPRYRLPEPIRAADHACGRARAEAVR